MEERGATYKSERSAFLFAVMGAAIDYRRDVPAVPSPVTVNFLSSPGQSFGTPQVILLSFLLPYSFLLHSFTVLCHRLFICQCACSGIIQ